MTEAESRAVGRLQGRAGELWSRMVALSALAWKAKEQRDPEPGTTWGDDVYAMAELAESIAETAAHLASDLDPIAIENKAKEAAK